MLFEIHVTNMGLIGVGTSKLTSFGQKIAHTTFWSTARIHSEFFRIERARCRRDGETRAKGSQRWQATELASFSGKCNPAEHQISALTSQFGRGSGQLNLWWPARLPLPDSVYSHTRLTVPAITHVYVDKLRFGGGQQNNGQQQHCPVLYLWAAYFIALVC